MHDWQEVKVSAGRFSPRGTYLHIGRGTDIVEDAVRAVRLAGLAYPASVKDQEVGEGGPVFFRHHFHEVLLYLYRIPTLREAEPVRDAADMGVDDDALVHAESVAEDHVGRLAADVGQGYEFSHSARDLSPVLLYEGVGHAPQGAGLVTVEAGRTDVLLEHVGGSIGVVLGLAVLREEALCYLVDLHVGGLGGEDRRHQELQGVRPVERGTGVGVLGLQVGRHFRGWCGGRVHDGRGLYPVLN